jgi:hypothetical protein
MVPRNNMKQQCIVFGSGLLFVAVILVLVDGSVKSPASPVREPVPEVSGVQSLDSGPKRKSPPAAKEVPARVVIEELPPSNPAPEATEPKVPQVVDADAAFLEEVMKLPVEMRLLAVEQEANRRLKEYEKNNAKVLKEGVIDRGKLFSYVVPRASAEEIKAMFAPFEKYKDTLTDKGARMMVDQEIGNFHRSESPTIGESKLLIAVVSDAERQVQYASIPISNHEDALEIMEEEVHPPPREVGVPYTYREGTRGLLKNASGRPWRMDHFVPKEDLVNIRHPHGKLR